MYLKLLEGKWEQNCGRVEVAGLKEMLMDGDSEGAGASPVEQFGLGACHDPSTQPS